VWRRENEHGERRVRSECDQLEPHHTGHAQWKLLQDLVRFRAVGCVHDEDNAVAIGLAEPLFDLTTKVVANSSTGGEVSPRLLFSQQVWSSTALGQQRSAADQDALQARRIGRS
jgi:hypothetical protein